ncbi:MAG: hypothetical protein JJ892_09890 [Balneola sp.]|nr:hypothetical protein [Balneola sp.]MBO6649491.1 hypothetical protein [Balneola sp.]MBO6711307.1 hypothetical protein [Balneola sp.]MBO6800578.1 hypothetical protein [Balneola sp.]MBO6869243.1 hypothetical protein [Balneola sp.]
MELIPEWAPNIHPMIVHFPIALFILAIIMDVAGYFLPESWWDEKKNLILYSLSGIAGIGTYFSGKEAADSVFIEAETQNLLTAHADWAEYTVWFMGLYALLRIGVYFWDKSEIKPLRIGLTLLSFVGAFLLYQAGDRGAQMVYQYGVGVQAVDIENPEQHDHETDHDEGMSEHSETSQESHDDSSMGNSTAFKATENGNWEWNIDKNAIADLKNNFHWLTGSLEEVNAEAVQTTNGSYALSFSGNNLNGFFVGHESYETTQVDYYLDISALEGMVMLTNNVQDESNFDFVSVASDGTVKQGRMVNGKEELFEEGTTDVSKSMFVRVVGNGTHFRGYVDKEMVVHGHGDAPKAGGVGIKIMGDGTVVLEKMSLIKL